MPVRQKMKRTQNQTPDVPQGRDLFQTPNYAIDLLIPFIPQEVYTIWEPACGEGKIVCRLEEYNHPVIASDIRGPNDIVDLYFNFLSEIDFSIINDFHIQGIITNPPFSLKRKFFEKCLEYRKPFALLIPADYSGWLIDAFTSFGCEKIIPTRRIDYITPSGLSGESGHTSNFHSMWLTWGFGLGRSETFVELTNEQKRNI